MTEDHTLNQTHFYTDDNSGELRARRYRVKVVKGPDTGLEAALEDGTFLIGTHASSQLKLADKGISRYHVELAFAPAGLKISDLDSTNGTFIAGSRGVSGTGGVLGAAGGTRVGSIVLPVDGNVYRFRLGTDTEIEIAPADVNIPITGYTDPGFGRVLGNTKPMRELFGLLAKISPTDATVLLEGETGTGKELLAEAIHKHSERRDGPYVIVDCGALPKDLIGSELFGHARGAFTGADKAKRGLIEAADGGTLFLDEIGELPLELQPQLLRALEKREVRPIGEVRAKKVNIRVIAATHRGLSEMVKAGTFREDLYFRLAVVRAPVPPLRKHKEDIPLLVEAFVRDLNRGDFKLSPEVEAQLMAHDWPGNVRELRNIVERGLSFDGGGVSFDTRAGDGGLGGDSIAAGAMSKDLLDMSFKDAKGILTESFEREYLTALLKRHNGNISRAAVEAQIDRNYIHRLVKKYNIPVDRS